MIKLWSFSLYCHLFYTALLSFFWIINVNHENVRVLIIFLIWTCLGTSFPRKSADDICISKNDGRMSHLKVFSFVNYWASSNKLHCFFSSWIDRMCFFKLLAAVKLISQMWHLNGFFLWWTDATCLFKLPVWLKVF